MASGMLGREPFAAASAGWRRSLDTRRLPSPVGQCPVPSQTCYFFFSVPKLRLDVSVSSPGLPPFLRKHLVCVSRVLTLQPAHWLELRSGVMDPVLGKR